MAHKTGPGYFSLMLRYSSRYTVHPTTRQYITEYLSVPKTWNHAKAQIMYSVDVLLLNIRHVDEKHFEATVFFFSFIMNTKRLWKQH